jgi:CheY-like chemotaxis protein
MPEMSGYEATQQIRSLPDAKARSIPIIAMTANVFREDVEEYLKVGMNDHLGKPLDLEKLLEKLDEYLIKAT